MRINYRKENNNDGCVYNQTITITSKNAKLFNKFINSKIQLSNIKHIKNSEDIKNLAYLECLHIGKNYITLTELNTFKEFYIKKIYIAPLKDKNFERILYRNTIIEVI